MEIPMRNMNTICMSIFMLGAAAIAAPALAQSADAKANAADQATPTEQAAAAGAAVSDSASDKAVADNQQAATTDTSAGKQSASSANSQTAMNSSNDAAANANLSSVSDTKKKYHRASRAKDFAAEQKITQQLNQQAAAAAKPGVQTAMNQ
jgi:hypothetical protein